MKQSNGDDNALIIFVCHLHPTLYSTFTQQTPYHNINGAFKNIPPYAASLPQQNSVAYGLKSKITNITK